MGLTQQPPPAWGGPSPRCIQQASAKHSKSQKAAKRRPLNDIFKFEIKSQVDTKPPSWKQSACLVISQHIRTHGHTHTAAHTATPTTHTLTHGHMGTQTWTHTHSSTHSIFFNINSTPFGNHPQGWYIQPILFYMKYKRMYSPELRHKCKIIHKNDTNTAFSVDNAGKYCLFTPLERGFWQMIPAKTRSLPAAWPVLWVRAQDAPIAHPKRQGGSP